MTNEQMIRELRAVAEKYKGKHVFTCETNISLMATDAANRIESLCDEINRQKAEIERLEHIRAELSKEADRIAEEHSDLIVEKDELFDIAENALKGMREANALFPKVRAKARAETVKEFAEMLKATAIGRVAWDDDDEAIEGFVAVDEIDNLVKEFMEGGNTQ